MDSNANQLPEINFDEAYILGQHPHEMGFRSASYTKLLSWLNMRLDLQGAELIDPTPTGTSGSPAVIPPGPSDRKGKFEPEPGFYQGFPEVTSDKRWYFYWDKTNWRLMELGDLPERPLSNIVNQDTDKGITPKGVDDALQPFKSSITNNSFDEITYEQKYNAVTALNGFYNATGVFIATSDFKCTPKNPALTGDNYRYDGKSFGGPYTVNGVYGFKEGGAIVTLVGVVNTTEPIEFTIPTDVVEWAANYYVPNGHSFSLEKVVVTKKFVAIKKDELGNVVGINDGDLIKKKTGKSICYIGNSLTFNGQEGQPLKGHQKWIADKFDFTQTTTYAYPGKPFGTFVTAEGTTIIEQFINNAIPHDIFILCFPATNDFRLGTRIGTFEDYKSLTSYGSVGNVISMNFYQSLKALILRCYELNPNAKIGFVTDIQRNKDFWNDNGVEVPYDSHNSNPAGIYLKDFVYAIKTVGEFESIPVADGWGGSGINFYTLPVLTSDGLHLLDIGYGQISKVIIPMIEQLII